MSRLVECYVCSCLRQATKKCRQVDCSHLFCPAHGDFLCDDCKSAYQENEESARKRARARLIRPLQLGPGTQRGR